MKLNNLTSAHFDIVAKQINYLAQKYHVLTDKQLSVLEDAGYEALYNAANYYDASRGASFTTYASYVIYNALLKEFKKLNSLSYIDMDNVDSVIYNPDCDWDFEDACMTETLHEAINQLSAEERHIIYQRFGFNGQQLKLRELGTIMNVSPQAIDKRINHILKKLKNYIDNYYKPYKSCA